MRGELDEALARMARREELLRRRTVPGEDRNAVPPTGDPLAEVAAAVRQVVAGHPGLSVDLDVAHAGTTWHLRVAWSDGTVTATSGRPAGPVPHGDVPAGMTGTTDPGTVGPTGGGGPGGSPPPSWPLPVTPVPAWTVDPGGPSDDPEARLAELLRRNPTLLENLRRSGDPS